MIAAKVDANQAELVDGLRHAGATVTSLHRVGGGVPDLLVGYRRRTFLLEVKGLRNLLGDMRPLTPAQKVWHAGWNGQVAVVATLDDALRAIGAIA